VVRRLAGLLAERDGLRARLADLDFQAQEGALLAEAEADRLRAEYGAVKEAIRQTSERLPSEVVRRLQAGERDTAALGRLARDLARGPERPGDQERQPEGGGAMGPPSSEPGGSPPRALP
jgi:hypothetical protein